MRFGELSGQMQTFLAGTAWILNLLQWFLMLQLLWYRQRMRALLQGGAACCGFARVLYLSYEIYYAKPQDLGMKAAVLVVLLTAAGLYTGIAIFRERKHVRDLLSPFAVKDTMDSLPIGICFFDQNGWLVLANDVMNRLAEKQLGTELLDVDDFLHALRAAADREDGNTSDTMICRFEDGRVWEFTVKTICSEERRKRYFTKVVATDHTKLRAIHAELQQENIRLQKSIEEARRIITNVAEITREQEILSAKMLVHNKMGNCMLSLRQVLLHPGSKEKKEQMIEMWESSMQMLKHEAEETEELDAWNEVIRIARTIGLEIVMEGEKPEDPNAASLLLTVLRECITNAKNHAHASRLYLRIRKEQGQIHAIYTNNGRAPENKIEEGGGLSSLRRKVEDFGAVMRVSGDPVFRLEIVLPDA